MDAMAENWPGSVNYTLDFKPTKLDSKKVKVCENQERMLIKKMKYSERKIMTRIEKIPKR